MNKKQQPARMVRLAILVLIVLSAFVTAHASVKQRPNIILVMPDDAGYGDYACLGNPIMRTPSVDSFKTQSLVFTQFHVSPTCSPCRAALMSGRHEFKNGVTHTIGGRERMALSSYTLPQMLKSVGYTTGIFGKWHLGDEAAYRPESRGFDEVYIHGSGGIGQGGDAPGNTNIDPALWHNGKFEKTKGYCTDLFFAQAIKWMDDQRKAKQPFFAYIPTNAPHAPHVVPEEYYQYYIGKPGVNSEDLAKYLGMVENIDTNFGTLLAKLGQWGITDNTLVIYLGTDNGGTRGRQIFNAGMKGGKNTSYQGGTRSPGFFRWPAADIPAGAECDALSAHIDIFPTLAEITGATLSAEVQQQLEGRSLVPLLKNPQAQWADRILVHHAGRWPAGQAEKFKYTKSAIQNSRFTLVNNRELYDLKADPGETKNVIAEHPEVVATLRAAYDQWWQDVQPFWVNENTKGFSNLTFRELYTKQFGAEATAEAMKNKGRGDSRPERRNERRATPPRAVE
ncbi:arylsulfatase [Planctomycetota bacterium]